MNANELADALDTIGDKYLVILGDIEFKKAADFVRQQAEKINNLEQWQKRQLDVIEAQKKLIEEQDKKIIDLAFRLTYAERGNEVAKELSNERK